MSFVTYRFFYVMKYISKGYIVFLCILVFLFLFVQPLDDRVGIIETQLTSFG